MNSRKRRENIVLIGFKASGKTRVGKMLAKSLGYKFLDADDLIEREHARMGSPRATVRGIYKKFGKKYFQSMEAKAVKKAALAKKAVISLGGGSPLNKGFNRKDFKNAGFVFLSAKPETLYRRMMKKGLPPFLEKSRPRASFNELLKKRVPVYEKLADVKVDNTERKPSQVRDEIIRKLEEKDGR